jgi:monoamine oxidase
MSRSGKQVDVVVVGAGLAGLTAATQLAAAGRDVVVVEARDRVGGRLESAQVGRARLDLGGQWLGPQQTRMLALVRELDVATFPTYHKGRKVLVVDGDRSTYAGALPSLGPLNLLLLQAGVSLIDAMARKVPVDDPWNAKRAAQLDATTVETWKRRMIPSRKVRSVLDAALRVVFGAEPSELSMLHFLWYVHQGGGILKLVEIRNAAQETRFATGAQTVPERLAERLGDRVVLSSPVERVAQHDDGVVVHAASGMWRAQRVVVALPPAMCGRIAYDPPLPPLRDELHQREPMGATIKFHVQYDTTWWRDAGYSGEAVCTDGPLSVVFDNTSHDGAQPVLLGFSVGRAARELGALDADERRRRVLDVLATCFGPEALAISGFTEKDWSTEEWTRGCPTASTPPGVMSVHGPALRKPCGRIHWAGTETARQWTGYMEGAVESGERVAAEILGVEAVASTAQAVRS